MTSRARAHVRRVRGVARDLEREVAQARDREVRRPARVLRPAARRAAPRRGSTRASASDFVARRAGRRTPRAGSCSSRASCRPRARRTRSRPRPGARAASRARARDARARRRSARGASGVHARASTVRSTSATSAPRPWQLVIGRSLIVHETFAVALFTGTDSASSEATCDFPCTSRPTWSCYQIRQSHGAARQRYPFVLMLEPLYTCNLACIGCSTERHTGKLADRLPARDLPQGGRRLRRALGLDLRRRADALSRAQGARRRHHRAQAAHLPVHERRSCSTRRCSTGSRRTSASRSTSTSTACARRTTTSARARACSTRPSR